MRRSILTSLLAAIATLLAVSPAAGKGSDLAWRAWDDGLREAKSTGRAVLVDVYTDWCGWCKRMQRDVYSRSDVREYLASRFVTIKLNAESRASATYADKPYTSRSLAAHFRVTGYPTTIFLRSGGEHLVNVPGYVPADRFLLLLQYIGDGHFERGVQFNDFARKAGPMGSTRR